MASNSIVMGLAALVFCTWSVSLAGIASIQEQCDTTWHDMLAGVNGFSADLPCYKVFRYHWFIVCLECALIFGLAGALATGVFAKTRLSWMGLFCVATLLYIQMTDTFLTMHGVSEDLSGQIKHRVRTMVAGTIMTSTVNCFLVIALGMNAEEPTPT
ncbi:hypothetical protein Agub_g9127, partial [Astrephomene gubernaculifera]